MQLLKWAPNVKDGNCCRRDGCGMRLLLSVELCSLEFQDLWPQLSVVIDGGPIGDVQSPECRLGSTVVDLSVSGKFTIIRPGCALTSTVEILRQKYGLIPESS